MCISILLNDIVLGRHSFWSRVLPLPLICLLLSGCWSVQNRWRPFSGLIEVRNQRYLADDHPKHALQIFAPPDAQGAPIVVFVHGGYWRSGDRSYFESLSGLYGNVGVALAEQGMVVVVPSYRLFPEVNDVGLMLDDVGAAIRYARAHGPRYGGDPQQIFLMGHSAGAHLVTLLAASPENLRARALDTEMIRGFVSVSGVYDIESCAAHARPPKMKHELWDPLFGDAEGKRSASPIHDLKEKAHPPALFLVGTDDYPNCLRDFAALEKAMTERGDPHATFVQIQDIDHEHLVLRIGSAQDSVTPLVTRFIHAQLGPGAHEAAPAQKPQPDL